MSVQLFSRSAIVNDIDSALDWDRQTSHSNEHRISRACSTRAAKFIPVDGDPPTMGRDTNEESMVRHSPRDEKFGIIVRTSKTNFTDKDRQSVNPSKLV
jgi:hypothetical protein